MGWRPVPLPLFIPEASRAGSSALHFLPPPTLNPPSAASLGLSLDSSLLHLKETRGRKQHSWGAPGPVWVNIWLAEAEQGPQLVLLQEAYPDCSAPPAHPSLGCDYVSCAGGAHVSHKVLRSLSTATIFSLCFSHREVTQGWASVETPSRPSNLGGRSGEVVRPAPDTGVPSDE